MKNNRIGMIMTKSSLRNNVVINLQKKGYRVYIIGDDSDMFDYIKELSLDLILIDPDENKNVYKYLNKLFELKIPSIALIEKHIGHRNAVELLKSGALDIIYFNDEKVSVVLDSVENFFGKKASTFELKMEETDKYIIFKIYGELDMSTTFKSKRKFDEIIKKINKDFILDISEVGYLESVGIGFLIYIKKMITTANKEFKVVIKSDKIKKLLEMTKLDKYFNIYNSLDEITVIKKEKKYVKAVVIDDARFMRKLISTILIEEGFEVKTFENPVLALKELDDIKPDIILVDHEMPEMNGLEFIEKFKPQEKEIPTIMLTTVEDINLALTAIRAGASDFLNKPFKKEELIHTIRKVIKENELKKENEILMLELQKREFELKNKNKELYSLYNNLEEELEMASEIQNNLLPKSSMELDNFIIHTKYLPSQDIGGDFYDFFRMSNNFFGIAFADISGHGIPAALLSSMLKVYMMTYIKDIINPSEAMEILNDVIAETYPDGKFVSLFYMILNDQKGTISYCKAAQEPGLYVKENGEIEELVTHGQVLGLFSIQEFPEMIDFSEKEIDIKKGEKIFLYTDGIVEARNHENEFYGLDRLKDILSKNSSRTGEELIKIVYDDLLDFIKELPILDDLTFLSIEKK